MGGEIQEQTRQHSRLINLLGVKQIAVGCNKMDCDTAGYKKARYEEVSNEMKSMLTKVGWKKDMVEKNIPFMPISGWMGDNLLKMEDSKGVKNMDWWSGVDVAVGEETIHEIKVGYSPIGFVRCGRSACRISKLKWKMGKETG